jgi:hypothetical protein
LWFWVSVNVAVAGAVNLGFPANRYNCTISSARDVSRQEAAAFVARYIHMIG